MTNKRRARENCRQRKETMKKVAVCISCFNEYTNRIRFVMEHLRNLGYECTYITSDFDHATKEYYTVNYANTKQIHVKQYAKNLSAGRIRSHAKFAKDAFRIVSDIRPDVLFVMLPPNKLAKEAAKYKKKHPEIKLIVDIFDMWPETFPDNRAKKLLAAPFTYWARLRNQALAQADVVTTECELYQSVLSQYCDKDKMHTLYLAKESLHESPIMEEDIEGISLCYLGSINNIVDIPKIADIIRKLPTPVQLHIVGDGERRQDLIAAAKNAGARVIFYGRVFDPKKKREVFGKCHFGLNIMKNSVFVGLTMKSMDYLEGGLPIINTITGDTWRMVQEHAIGINYSEDTSFERQLFLPTVEDKQRVKAFFENNFTEEAFQKRLEEIFTTLA